MTRPRIALDPAALARWQRDADRALAGRTPPLLARKRARMASSPHAFLRGSAGLFHRMLASSPGLAEGPRGGGWIVGDLHVENFGAYRAEEGAGRRGPAAFDVNDLDLAALGPWRYDLTRLATSLLLAAQERGLDGEAVVSVARSALEGWRDAAFGECERPAPPGYVARMVEKVGRRTHESMLADRTVVSAGGRRFQRGERYADLGERDAATVVRAFGRYVDALAPEHRPREEQAEVEDVAFRVAGTGSLGVLRVAVLTRGNGKADGHWIFDMKETLDPPVSEGFRVPDVEPAERVVMAMRGCLGAVPRMLGAAMAGRRSMLVRRLSPQEDKVDVGDVTAAELPEVARFLGAVAAGVHVRGATRPPSRAWSDRDLEGVLGRAVTLAGAHVATWLAWCAAGP